MRKGMPKAEPTVSETAAMKDASSVSPKVGYSAILKAVTMVG